MIKAAFFDIDGTLVSFKTHRISDAVLEALSVLRKNGVRLYIASGRHHLLIDNLSGFEFDGYICMNGGLVIDSGKTVFRHPMNAADAVAVAEIADSHSIPCAFFCEDSFGVNVMNSVSDEVFKMVKMPYFPFKPVLKGVEEPVYQFTIFVDEAVERELITPNVHELDSTRWNPKFTDLIPENISKAEGIEKIISAYGIRREETIAFGDGGNDVEMLEYAGIGVAMGNADDGVKAAADYVTSSVDEDGVCAALKYFGLI